MSLPKLVSSEPTMLVYLQVIEGGLVVGGGGEGTAREVHVVGGAQDEHFRPIT